MVSVFFSLLVLLAVTALLLGVMNYGAPLATAKFLRNMARRKAGLKTGVVEVEGLQVPYLVGGQGAPLVLLHGFTANKDIFVSLAQYLTGHYTVYIPDMPGFGETTRDVHLDYGVHAQARRLWAFTQALNLNQFHLGGNSLGGWIAAWMARDHTEAVQSLWLIDAFGTKESFDSPTARRSRDTGVIELLVRNAADNAKKWAFITSGKSKLPYCMNYAMGVMGAKDFDFHKQMWASLAKESPLDENFGVIRVPTFIVYGSEDRVSPPASSKTLERIFTQNRIQIMDGLGHIPMVEDAKKTASDYRDFRSTLG